jgi:arginine-tRNA-protein transferase
MGMGDAQTFSHFPTWPLPIAGVERVTISDRQPCGYLTGRTSMFRAFEVSETDAQGTGTGMTGQEYQRLMDAGFRRSGTIIYQPMCARCRACVPIRVPVAGFVPSKSQRRVLRAKKDLVVDVQRPEPTREKWEIYESYQRQWHAKKIGDEDVGSFVQFLYRSPVETVEFEYRDRWGKLLAVGICDICPESLSSVYFYFDPREASRSLGTYGALYEIAWAREMKLKYWYAGYWIRECPSMAYKSRFGPCETLGTDGVWRALNEPE